MQFDPDAMMDAMAAFLDLPILPECRAGVGAHLTAARAIAAPLLALELDDEAEPAPVYTP